MMRVAFYAPMKPPDHPVPSGDRRLARLLIRAFRDSGHEVTIASRLRSYDRTGDPARQQRIRRAGQRLAARFIHRNRNHRPDLWFTYHLYHKAPDWLGPAVSAALSIPYVVADASVAPKQAEGPWAEGYRATNAAIAQACRIIAFDPIDIPCVTAQLGTRDRLSPLLPFADVTPRHSAGRQDLRRALAREHQIDPAEPWLATVAMMRCDAKLESYRVLADALAQLDDHPWSLLVAGDGAARETVEAMLGRGGRAPRIRFLGQLDRAAVRRLYHAADLAVWPAVREGCSMALVEAQALGVPVVAGDRPGIAQAVRHGETGLLSPVGDSTAFARAIGSLIADPARRDAMAAASEHSRRRFSLRDAARRLDAILHAARHEARA